MVEQLQQLVTSGRIRAPNYFNGRLLSAGDLQQEREANRELLARAARATGAGVAFGFEVIAGSDANSVRVRAGLAVGPYGDVLQLDDDADLKVIATVASGSGTPLSNGATGFRPCQPPPVLPTAVTNPALHLLAVGPASGTDGLVATSTLASAPASCSIRDSVTGLQFVLLPFRRDLEQKLRSDNSSIENPTMLRSRFRSRAALACFGLGPTFPPSPGVLNTPLPSFGTLATVTDPALPACHVPLALVNIAATGVDFIDMWAARRGLAAPSAAGFWGPWFGARARTESEAMTLSFQDQIEGIVGMLPNPNQIAADDWFVWLPPVGMVPVWGVGNSVGIDYSLFFRALAARQPEYVPLGLVPTLFDEALRCPPTPVGGKTKPLVWLYRVRENLQPFAFGQSNLPRPVMLFASGFARYLGDARYDVSQWDFGNYA